MMPCHTARNVTAPMILHLAPISDTTATGILARKQHEAVTTEVAASLNARALPHLFRHREKDLRRIAATLMLRRTAAASATASRVLTGP